MNLSRRLQDAVAVHLPVNSLRKRFAVGMGWVFAGAFFRQAATFLTGILVARVLGVNDFGKLAAIQSTILMIANFGQTGIGLSTTRHLAAVRTSDPERAGRIIGFSLAVTSIAALFVGAALFAFSPRLIESILPESGLAAEMMLASWWAMFELVGFLQLRILAGLESFRSNALINLFQGLCLPPFILFGAYSYRLVGCIAAMTAAGFLACLIGHSLVRKECGAMDIPITRKGIWRERSILKMSMSVWICDVAMNAANWLVGMILVGRPGGVAEFGLFSAAARLQNILLFFPTTMFQVCVPVLSNLQAQGNRQSFSRTLAAAGALTMAVAVAGAATFFIFPELLMSFFGSDFIRGVELLKIVALCCVVSSTWTVATAALWAAGESTAMLTADLIRGLLLITITLSGFVAGAENLALSYLISYSAGLGLLLVFLIRFMKKPWPSTELALQPSGGSNI